MRDRLFVALDCSLLRYLATPAGTTQELPNMANCVPYSEFLPNHPHDPLQGPHVVREPPCHRSLKQDSEKSLALLRTQLRRTAWNRFRRKCSFATIGLQLLPSVNRRN